MPRRFFPAFMLALGLGAPAFAASCPEKPTKISYDSGAVVEVISYEENSVTWRQTIAASGQVIEMRAWAGLVTETALRGGEGALFDWKQKLPSLGTLRPGLEFAAEAWLTTPGVPGRAFTSEVKVIGFEEIAVAGCSYELLKVEIRNNESGRALGVNTKWLHLPSLLTLKSEVTDHGSTKPQAAVLIE